MRTLTAKQDAYARGVADGMTHTAAYRAAYDLTSVRQEMVYVESSRLVANPKIELRIAVLREAKWRAENLPRESLIAMVVESSQRAREAGDIRGSLKGECDEVTDHSYLIVDLASRMKASVCCTRRSDGFLSPGTGRDPNEGHVRTNESDVV